MLGYRYGSIVEFICTKDCTTHRIPTERWQSSGPPHGECSPGPLLLYGTLSELQPRFLILDEGGSSGRCRESMDLNKTLAPQLMIRQQKMSNVVENLSSKLKFNFITLYWRFPRAFAVADVSQFFVANWTLPWILHSCINNGTTMSRGSQWVS